MSSAILHTEPDTSLAELETSPSFRRFSVEETPVAWPELLPPAVPSRGWLGCCRLLLSVLGGYLASTLIHVAVLVSLAVWIIRAEPRHSEPLSLSQHTLQARKSRPSNWPAVLRQPQPWAELQPLR